MKTKEELCAIKEEVETMGKKLAELSEDELKEVTGGGNNEEHNVMLADALTAGEAVIGAVSAPVCWNCHKKVPLCAVDHGSVTCPFCGETVNF